MKITLKDVNAFNKMYPKLADKPLPLPVAYKLAKLYKVLSSDIEFFNSKMSDYIKHYAMKDEQGKLIFSPDGTGIKIAPENVDECNQKIHELEEMDVQAPNCTFSLDEFGNISFTPNEISVLLPFIG